MQRHHSAMVENFFYTGKSKYFKNIDISFGLEQQGFIFPMYMYFDINSMTDKDFAFTLFIRKCEYEFKDTIFFMCDN